MGLCGFGRTNPYTRSFLVGCLNPCLQGTSVRIGPPQPAYICVSGDLGSAGFMEAGGNWEACHVFPKKGGRDKLIC